MTAKRPLLLYMLLVAMAILALANALQVVQTVQSSPWLTALGYAPAPIYKVFEGAFFMLLFIAGGILLWARSPIAPVLNGTIFAVYFAWSWIDSLLITVNPSPLSSHLFAGGVSLGLLLLAEFSFYLLTPFMRQTSRNEEKDDKDGRSES